MDLLNNANTIASLVVTIIVICGYLYGAVSYLKNKAAHIPQDAADMLSQTSAPSHPPTMPLQQLTWLEWTELLARGLVDTADFILRICIQGIDDVLEEKPIISRLVVCLLLCMIGIGLGGFILGLIISFMLFWLGVQDSGNVSLNIAFVLLFSVLFFIYIYHIGLRIEQKRKEQYQALKRQYQAQ
jgi:hypothetical protein